jgi:hypothetical protein
MNKDSRLGWFFYFHDLYMYPESVGSPVLRPASNFQNTVLF